MGKCLQDHLSVRGDGFTVFHGSNLDVLPLMADNSVDSIVTDPPYELGFMGKKWDSSGIAYSVELWQECLRVLKPGGHLLAFSGSRTYHRMVVAIEDAGFEIRDMVSWISNKTFPKSLDISKAIDKAAGAEREVVQILPRQGATRGTSGRLGWNTEDATQTKDDVLVTAPTTDDAKKWAGWGTALKPTVEPVVMARKPLVGTVAENVLTWGVGGLNIDGSRIGTEEVTINTFDNGAKPFGDAVGEPYSSKTVQGRWPANLILDEEAASILDEQSGERKGMATQRNSPGVNIYGGNSLNASKTVFPEIREGYNDSGGASRFFYVAKASKRDRNEGLDELPAISAGVGDNRPSGDFNQRLGTQDKPAQPKQNFHPTVKPTDLMRYLIKLVTPAGGTVLDPFTGSGSTGKAAILDGYNFVGIELTDDYLPIIEGRLTWAANHIAEQKTKQQELEKETLF